MRVSSEEGIAKCRSDKDYGPASVLLKEIKEEKIKQLLQNMQMLKKMKEQNQIEIYQAKDGTTQITVQFDQETVWLTQAQMGQLFEKNKRTISEHIRNIFKEGELEEKVVVRKSRTTTQHGAMAGKTQTSKVSLYSLDVIISVGYRVKSQRGTQFRIWANSILKDYLVKGYATNEKRLAQKEQEVKLLKDGIQILSRAIEEIAADNDWLSVFAANVLRDDVRIIYYCSNMPLK